MPAGENPITTTLSMTNYTSPSAQAETISTHNEILTTEKGTPYALSMLHSQTVTNFIGLDPTVILMSDSATKHPSSISLSTTTSSMTDSTTSAVQSNINIIVIGVSIAVLLILSTALIITATVLIWSYKRRSSKQVNNCSLYFTLNRRAGQPQPLQQESAQLYDQIHLSPSTGQTEYVPKSENANRNNPSQSS